MKDYTSQLTIEAITVGLTTIGAYYLVRTTLPDSSLLTQLFVTGAGLHLTFESLGINRWYLSNGAASY